MDFDDLDEQQDVAVNNQPAPGTILPLMKRSIGLHRLLGDPAIEIIMGKKHCDSNDGFGRYLSLSLSPWAQGKREHYKTNWRFLAVSVKRVPPDQISFLTYLT